MAEPNTKVPKIFFAEDNISSYHTLYVSCTHEVKEVFDWVKLLKYEGFLWAVCTAIMAIFIYTSAAPASIEQYLFASFILLGAFNMVILFAGGVRDHSLKKKIIVHKEEAIL